MRGRGAGWDEEGIVSAMRGAERVMVRLGADTGGPGAGKDGDCGRGVLKKSAGGVPGGGQQRTENMRRMSVTPEVSQLETSALKSGMSEKR